MRSLLLLLLVAGCEPDVAYGSYLCGENQLCPEGQVCDGESAHCVSPIVAVPFACDPGDESHEPDDTPAGAQPTDALTCPSELLSINGCVAATDAGGDWYTLAVPATCTGSVVLHLHIAYPLAWQATPFELGDATGTILEQSGACGPEETSLKGAGLIDECLKRTLAPGTTYTIHVYPGDPGTSCDGDCTFNRYLLTAQLLSS